MSGRVAYTDRFHLRLLARGPFIARLRGGWRFGTKTISDRVVDRLIASGEARRDGDQVSRVWTTPPSGGGE
jgi:hypothetical protein